VGVFISLRKKDTSSDQKKKKEWSRALRQLIALVRRKKRGGPLCTLLKEKREKMGMRPYPQRGKEGEKEGDQPSSPLYPDREKNGIEERRRLMEIIRPYTHLVGEGRGGTITSETDFLFP